MVLQLQQHSMVATNPCAQLRKMALHPALQAQSLLHSNFHPLG